MLRVLSDDDVRNCLTFEEAIDAIEEACRQAAEGGLVEARTDVRLPNGWMRVMPAALAASGVFGYKEFHLVRVEGSDPPAAEVRYAMHLFDARDGRPLAFMDANSLTAIRTASTAAVAARCMTAEDAGEVGVIGSGAEARSQLRAIATVRPLRRVRVFSRSEQRRAAFARDMAKALGVDVEAVRDARAAVEGATILIVATNTAGAGTALEGRWLHEGLHVSSIGSTSPVQRELAPDVWERADRIVLDTMRALEESGDAIAAREAGTLHEERLVELPEVVAGAVPGRATPGEITLYKSIGRAMQDVAVAARAWTLAERMGIGREADEVQAPKVVEPN